mgnify:CR=1 FL=1
MQKYKQLGRTRHHKKKPLGDAKLGKLIGIKGDALGCYERGEVTPSIKMAVRIAQALEVSLDWLVGLNDELLDHATTKRILDLQNLPHEDREALMLTIDNFIKATKLKAIQ